jgi:hypothetical protein
LKEGPLTSYFCFPPALPNPTMDTDNQERQRAEITAIQAVYPDWFQECPPPKAWAVCDLLGWLYNAQLTIAAGCRPPSRIYYPHSPSRGRGPSIYPPLYPVRLVSSLEECALMDGPRFPKTYPSRGESRGLSFEQANDPSQRTLYSPSNNPSKACLQIYE